MRGRERGLAIDSNTGVGPRTSNASQWQCEENMTLLQQIIWVVVVLAFFTVICSLEGWV